MRLFTAAVLWAALGIGGAFAQNAIATENLLAGTPSSQWDLSGPGSTSIEGFATDISFNHGSTVGFKVRTSSNNWRIDIYRLGYYQGNGARLVATIPVTQAQSQPAAVVNSTTGEVDAGNWAVSASWAIPASAISGVYIAKLTDMNAPAKQNHIPFIVRADESHSDVLFQTSDTTWQAYNGWGGANLYGGNGPGGDSAPGRAFKVSYNRPIATRDGIGTFSGPQDFLFGAEYAALYWLEQNGYDVSYAADVDTARNGALLSNHKIFTSTGHDEYWDTVARANVEAARASGVSLVFMSGNEVYWKTRWEPSIDGSATPYRTLVCYKETRAGAPSDPLDPPNWTGTWRDPRFSPPANGGRPENALTGTIFQVDSYRSDSIKVPYEMSQLRFWRNTPHVARAQAGATTTLTQNILGYEWDISPDNGFAPAGLIDLSSTTLTLSTYLLDYGTMTGAGTATHNLTLYKDQSSGALVFGAGTVFWSWGLSDNHDGETTPTVSDIQQATVNLLADMGAQPTTLQAGLVLAAKSSDNAAPTSGISAPAMGATFSEGQPVAISGFASDVGRRVAGVEVSVDGGATWRRASGTTSWTYPWNATSGSHTILSRATDDSLNTETPAPGLTISVTPAGATLFGATPVPESATAIDAYSVELGVRFSASTAGVIAGLRFWKDSINNGPHTAHLWSSAGTLLASATFANETATGWQTALFATPVAIGAGATYTASYHTSGFYSGTDSYFASAKSSGPLTAPVNASVYVYSSAVTFPNKTYNFQNYWVDVLYYATPPTAAPAITSALTAAGVVGAPFSYQITASNGPSNFNATGLPVGLSVNASTGLISGTPTAAGAASVSLTATNAIGTGSATLALTIQSAPAPVLTSALAVDGTLGTPFNYAITATNNPTGFSATGLPAGLVINATTGVISGTPAAAGAASVTLGASNANGAGSATLSLTINPAPSGYTLFLASSAPGVVTVNDASSVELGVKFVATTAGTITGMRFYKGPQNNGIHTAELWNLSGTKLASATFARESTSGWQTVAFATPVAIAANTTYVASYHSSGYYSANSQFFAAAYVNGPLTAPASAASGGNGVYAYGSSVKYPSSTFGASNYWVDVVFSPSGAIAPPSITSALTASGVVGAAFSYQITASNTPTGFNATGLPPGLAINTATGVISGTPSATGTSSVALSAANATGTGTATLNLTIQPASAPVINSALTATGAVGVPFNYIITAANTPISFDAVGLPAGLSINTAAGVISGTPAGPGTFNVTLSASNAGGTGSATLTLTFISRLSLFPASSVPATVTVNDPAAVELGVKFSATRAGNVIGMLFYKGPQNIGVHTGELWDAATGILLATSTFANETASGWQAVTFSTPVPITAGATYIASYHSNGFYSANSSYFAAAYANGPLNAPASAASGGNGVYIYGSAVKLPTNTYSATNYWVDVLFQ